MESFNEARTSRVRSRKEGAVETHADGLSDPLYIWYVMKYVNNWEWHVSTSQVARKHMKPDCWM